MENSRKRILIVDDDEAFLQTISDMLTHLGYEVRPHSDCFEALELLQSETFHLVIIDMIMPEVGGLVLSEVIRQDHPETPVLGVSGFHDKLAKIPIERKFRWFLSKPIKLKRLRTVLDEIFSSTSPTKRPDSRAPVHPLP